MQTTTRALPLPAVFLKWSLFAAFSLYLFLYAVPQVQAAGLTESQYTAVIGLLKSFDVAPETIAEVERVLGKEAAVTSEVKMPVETANAMPERLNAQNEKVRVIPPSLERKVYTRGETATWVAEVRGAPTSSVLCVEVFPEPRTSFSSTTDVIVTPRCVSVVATLSKSFKVFFATSTPMSVRDTKYSAAFSVSAPTTRGESISFGARTVPFVVRGSTATTSVYRVSEVSVRPTTASSSPRLVTLSTDAKNYAPGAKMVVRWIAEGGAAAKDFIGIVIKGTPWESSLKESVLPTKGKIQGSETMLAPSRIGEYELVYVKNNGTAEAARYPFFVRQQTVQESTKVGDVQGLFMERDPLPITSLLGAAAIVPYFAAVDWLTDLLVDAGIGQ